MTFAAAKVTVGLAALNPPYAHSCTRHFGGRGYPGSPRRTA